MQIVAFAIAVIALAILIVLLNDRFRRAEWKGRPVIPYPDVTRFSNPQFGAVEARIGGKFAESFTEFYTHDHRVKMKEIRIAHPTKGELRLASFIPCDLAGVEENMPETWSKQFPFALVEEGDYLLVPLGAPGDDCPVFQYHQDGGDQTRLFDSFREFGSALRPAA